MVGRTHMLRQSDREYLAEMAQKRRKQSQESDFQRVLDAEMSKLQGKESTCISADQRYRAKALENDKRG